MRFRYGKLSGEIYSSIGLGMGTNLWNDDCAHLHFHLVWPNIYINIPTSWFKIEKNWSGEDRRYGFTFFERDIHINMGEKTKVIHLPWAWKIVRHDLMYVDGSLYHRNDFNSDEKRTYMFEIIHSQGIPALEASGLVQRLPYQYTLRSGEVQKTMATVYGEEREWRWKWFKWLPLFRRIERSISIDFDQQIGEGVGEWKGGTLGCGWNWSKDWTMEEALLDMENNRKFER